MHTEWFWYTSFIYLVPTVLLMGMSIEMYLRNRRKATHITACAAFALLSLFIFGEYVRQIVPPGISSLIVVFVTAPAFTLIVGLLPLLYRYLCFPNTRMTWRLTITLMCAIPFLIYIGAAATLQPEQFYRNMENSFQSPLHPNLLIGSYITILIYYLLSVAICATSLRVSESVKETNKNRHLLAGIVLVLLLSIVVISLRSIGLITSRIETLGLFLIGVSWAAHIRYIIYRFGMLHPYEQRFRTLFMLGPTALLLVNSRGAVIEANPKARSLIGSGMTAKQMPFYLMIDPAAQQAFREQFEHDLRSQTPRTDIQLSIQSEHGQPLFVMLDYAFDEIDGARAAFVFIRDITELKLSEQKLVESEQKYRTLAYHDILTGLPNRASFNKTMSQLLDRRDATKEPFAVLLFDLDYFKQINDTLGHEAGDRLLQLASERTRASIPADSFLARLGGDEFVILLERAQEAEQVCMSLVAALHHCFEYNGHTPPVSISVGLSRYPEHGSTQNELLKAADKALYKAKSEGRNRYAIYS